MSKKLQSPIVALAGVILAAGVVLVSLSPTEALEWKRRESPEGAILYAHGEIKSDDFKTLYKGLSQYGETARILELDSVGGDLVGGMRLGDVLRDYGFDVRVTSGATCVSACLFAFIGGEPRTVDVNGQLGFHQFVGTSSESAAQSMLARMMQQLVKMGVSSSVLVDALATPSSSMHYFTPEEMRAYHLVAYPKSAALDPNAIIMNFDPNAPHRPDCPFDDGFEVKDALGILPGCQ